MISWTPVGDNKVQALSTLCLLSVVQVNIRLMMVHSQLLLGNSRQYRYAICCLVEINCAFEHVSALYFLMSSDCLKQPVTDEKFNDTVKILG